MSVVGALRITPPGRSKSTLSWYSWILASSFRLFSAACSRSSFAAASRFSASRALSAWRWQGYSGGGAGKVARVRVAAAVAVGSVAGVYGGGGGVSREAGTSICSNLIRSSSSRFFLASAQPMRAQARVARNGVMCCVATGRNAAASTGRSAITRAKPKAAPARCIVAARRVAVAGAVLERHPRGHFSGSLPGSTRARRRP